MHAIELDFVESLEPDAFLRFLRDYSNTMEERVFVEERTDAQTRRDLTGFLDTLLSFINSSEDQAAVMAAMRMFRMWKLLLMDRFNHVYERDFSAPDVQEKEQDDIERLRHATRPEGFDELMSRISECIRMDDGGGAHCDDLKKARLHKRCLIADQRIKQSDLVAGWRELMSVCRDVRLRPEPTFADVYYHSWALHLKGNVLVFLQHHRLAGDKYRESLRLKEMLEAPARLPYLQTRLKVAMNDLVSDARQSFSSLSDICERIQTERLADKNMNLALNIRTDSERYMAIVCLYADKRKEGLKFANAAIDTARNIGDHVGILKAQLLSRMLGGTLHISDLESSIIAVPEHVRLKPNFRLLWSNSALRLVDAFDPELANALVAVGESNKIPALDLSDQWVEIQRLMSST